MSQKNWIAEFDINEDLVIQLLQTQFPKLSPLKVKLLAAGWDNTAFLVNDTYVFRFPRRKEVLELIKTEIKVLPAIAKRLPLQITAPSFIGLPSQFFPHHFAGYEHLPGKTAEALRLNDKQRDNLAVPLAEFLAALHSINETEAATLGATRETTIKTNLLGRVEMARKNLQTIKPHTLANRMEEIVTILDSASNINEKDLGLVHADFHARHFLIENNQLTGIIDWGDVQIGHPSTDLAAAFLFLPPNSRDKFRDSYGIIDDSTWKAANIHAACDIISLMPYAIAIDNQGLLFEVRQGLKYLLS